MAQAAVLQKSDRRKAPLLPLGLADRQQARLQALYQLSVEVLELRDLQGVFDKALAHCLALTESEFGFIGLNNGDRSAMDVVAIQGFEAAPDFYSRFHLIPLRPNIFARVVLEDRPVRSDDAVSDSSRIGQPRGHPPVRAFLGVPLRVSGKPIGMIGVANRPDRYSAEDEQLLATYASQVAIAIHNAGLYEELQAAKNDLEAEVSRRTAELAQAKQALAEKAEQLQKRLQETLTIQEAERERIAHDMHDGVNQLIIGTMYEVKAARERLRADDHRGADRALRQVRSILGQVDSELRRIIFDLRPPTLDAFGLAESVCRYAERFHAYSGIACPVEIRGQPIRLREQVEIDLYRVMQETLTNVSRHAHARSARVTLNFSPEAVELLVADDGRGFDSRAVRQAHHLGLIGMEERASRMGGQLLIDSRPGAGCQVTLRIPLVSLR